jgi:hypothetical protein
MNTGMTDESVDWIKTKFPDQPLSARDVQILLGFFHIFAACMIVKNATKGSLLITLCMILNICLLANPYVGSKEPEVMMEKMQIAIGCLGVSALSFLK